MLRQSVSKIISRCYQHDSRFREKLPVVRPANSRIRHAISRRRDAESPASLRLEQQYAPGRFEPFPFKVTEENKLEVLQRIITPLYNIPYEEQLASKESYCKDALRLFGMELYRRGTPVRLDVSRLPCQIHPIVKSPILHGYRNKDEFSLWRGHDGVTKTVGFMAFPLGKHGDTVCVEPNGCLIMKEESVRLVDILQDFMRNHAKMPICYRLGDEGGWRRFMIRSNEVGHLMLIGVANPRLLRVKQLIEDRENFKEFITGRCQQAGLELKSLYFQPCPHNFCTHQTVPFELLHGDKTISEDVNGYKFVVSPESFMHQNTRGSEVLYKTIRKTIEDCFGFNPSSEQKPLIINANCGVGVLAVHLSDMSSKTVGVDSSSQAIDDAKQNANLNRIANSEFICSNLEIVLERILAKHSRHSKEVMVVCNPSKAGLHSNVVDCLRDNANVNKIVYVTPKIDAKPVMNNLLTLCSKRIGKAPPPFALVSATPVDVYPLIETFETILILERLPE